MRILVTRPRGDAERFARLLREAGHEAVVAPVMRIEATGAPIPAGAFDAVVAASSHALKLAGAALQTRLAAPVYCVGERTAEAARAAGFSDIEAVAKDASALGERLGGLAGKRVLYLAGVDRKPLLEELLRNMGAHIVVAEVYRACAAEALDDGVAEAFRTHRIDAVAHFSRRSAALFAMLAQQAGVADAARAARHFCLSADAAGGLAPLGGVEGVWPDAPDIRSLLRLIGAQDSAVTPRG